MGDFRAIFVDAVINDPILNTLGLPPTEVFQRGSFVDEVPTRHRPFAVFHLGTEVPVGSTSALRATRVSLLVWIHDLAGDYFRINEVLDRMRYVVEAVRPFDDLLEIRWMERSQDLTDTDMSTICRWDRYEAQFTPRGAQL